MRWLLYLLPMLLRNKRSWPVVAVLGVGYYLVQNGMVNIPGLSGLIGTSGAGFSMPDMSISQLWKEPREILVDRVEDARDAQTETVEEFKTALQKFKDVTGFDGGDLEEKYNTLSAAYERSSDAADNIDKRIGKVESAANTLLTEWSEELKTYRSDDLRRRAERQFDLTRQRANQLIAAMRNAEAKTKPVLTAFKDQVLYLKHNLNMKAIASLDGQAIAIEQDVSLLVREMEASIAEANAFIDSLSTQT